MLCVTDLLEIELFKKLPMERLEWICDRAELIELTSGETLLKEGDARTRVLHCPLRSDWYLSQERRRGNAHRTTSSTDVLRRNPGSDR